MRMPQTVHLILHFLQYICFIYKDLLINFSHSRRPFLYIRFNDVSLLT